jgi:Zn-dependent metalloprotease
MRRVIAVVLFCVVSNEVSAGGMSREQREAHITSARQRATAHLRDQAMALGIRDLNDLKEARVSTAGTTTTSFWYQQFDRGIKVFKGELLVVVDRDRISVSDATVKALNLPDGARMPAAKAEGLAIEHLKLKGRPEVESELVILPQGSLNAGEEPAADTFAWIITVRPNEETDKFDVREVIIDAVSGRVLSNRSKLEEITYWLGGPALSGMYQRRSPELFGPVDNTFTQRYVLLRDPCYGTGLPLSGYQEYVINAPDARLCGHQQEFSPNITGWVIDGQGNWVGDSNGRLTTNGSPFKVNGQPSLIGTGVLGATDAATIVADAFNSMYFTFRYLEMTHQYEGLDGSNGPVVHALVRQPMDSAIWDPGTKTVQIGKRDYPLTSIDVVSHEIGHGLTAYGPALVTTGESGKLNEAFSDMLAMLVSNAQPTHDGFPWWIGELTFAANYDPNDNFDHANASVAIRRMDDPVATNGFVCYVPSIGSEPNHRGAGVANHMFYLLAYGGVSKCDGSTVTGIGVQDAGAIWFNARGRLLSTSGFHDLRLAFTAAAQALFPGPSPQMVAVDAACTAVQIP